MEIQITNGSVDMVEIGWVEIGVSMYGKTHTLAFETEERPSIPNKFSSVIFANDDSIKLAKKIGFKITEDFMSELYTHWDNYSNRNFRG